MRQQKQIFVLVVLVAVAIAVWIWNRHQNPVTAGASSVAAGYSPLTVENPAIRTWKIDKIRKTEYKSSGRNPFDPTPPPPPAPRVPKPGDRDYIRPAPPPPPPLELPPNFKFYGYGTVPNGSARRAFLTDGDEVYIVAEGDSLLGRYRILKIGNATISFEEISSGRQGNANLEDAGPAT
jgi:hypothetical protein